MLHSQQCGYENLQNFTSDENEKLVDFRDNAKVRRRYSPQEGRAMRRALRNNRQAPAAFSSEPLEAARRAPRATAHINAERIFNVNNMSGEPDHD
jgi:hypothetical protein